MPTYDHGVAGLTGTIGVTVLNADGTAHDARATAGITEPVAGSGIYHFAHPHPGTLLLFVFDGGVGTVGGSVYDDGLSTVPARAGDAMDLVNAPNATALAAIKTAMEAAGSTLATLLSRIVGTLLAGNHSPQSGDGYGVVSNATHGNAALKTLVDAATAAAAGGYIDGDTLVTQATEVDGVAIGRTTAGATVTAYLAADTSRATPKRQATADEDGDWSIYLTGGSTYTLVFAKSGYSEATAEVTVA